MTHEEKLKACKEELLYPRFLTDYAAQLHALFNNPSFMREIRAVSETTAEDLLFGEGIRENATKYFRFQEFKTNFCDTLFHKLKFCDYPEYREIYDRVKRSGHAGKSATISVFYAMVYFDLSKTPAKKKRDWKAVFTRLLWGDQKPPTKPKPTIQNTQKVWTNSGLRTGFAEFLTERGYKKYTPSGNPSTIRCYLNGIEKVCAEEGLDWAGLAQNITDIIPKYDLGGAKESLGNKSHRTVINALLRFSEFLKQ